MFLLQQTHLANSLLYPANSPCFKNEVMLYLYDLHLLDSYEHFMNSFKHFLNFKITDSEEVVKEVLCPHPPVSPSGDLLPWYCVYMYIVSELAQSCPTRSDPMGCSLPGSSVHGIFQARVLESVAISFSRGSSRPRDQTWVSRIVDRRFTI